MVLTTLSFLPSEDKYLGSQEQETWIQFLRSLYRAWEARLTHVKVKEAKANQMGDDRQSLGGPLTKARVSARGFYC